MADHRVQDVLAMAGNQLFIGGKWVDAQDGGTFDVLDPATGLC